ncbi:MAG: two-component sensor histidine kinase [Actinomycetales bacterium]|nr:two-component sensor histidine kinase [Actinomycetales bacterium]
MAPGGPVEGEVGVVLVALLTVGALLLGLWAGWSRGRAQRAPGDPRPHAGVGDRALAEVLSALPDISVLLDEQGVVRAQSTAARGLGIVRDGHIADSDLADLIASARRERTALDSLIEVDRPPPARDAIALAAYAIPLSTGGVALVARDLTALQRIDSVRRDFLANISHELKTPVGALALLAEAIDEAGDDVAVVRRFTGRIQAETSRLTVLVNDLVDLTRIQAAEVELSTEPVSVALLLREALDTVRAQTEARGIACHLHAQPDLFIPGDEGQLVAALRNLLVNAVAYSPEGTAISLRATERDGVVELAVSDEGIGIPEAEQDRVFERFYRVDSARSRATGGTGLGLAIVKHVCHNHGGEVTLRSSPGRGSTFTMRLPGLRRDPQAHAAAAAAAGVLP